jgi:hypothetical protein
VHVHSYFGGDARAAKQLARSCDILNPEEVKEFIANKETWNSTTKLLTVEVYKAFATAASIEEAGKLIQAGFEYVCHHNDIMLYRKRK